MRLKLFLFLFLSLFSMSAVAITPKPASIPPPKAAVPDPMKLTPSWWEYFNVEDDELIKHIQKTKESLKRLEVTEEDTQALSLISRIEQRLDTLPETKVPLPTLAEPSKKFQARYNLDELITLGKELHENEENYRATSKKIFLEENKVKSESVFLDNLFAQYLNLTEKSPERLITGLEIILTKLELTLDQHRLKLSKRTLEEKKNLQQLLYKEIKFARTHLAPSSERQQTIDENITDAEKQAASAQAEAFLALSNLNRTLDPKQFSLAEREIAAQTLSKTNVNAATAQAALINAQLQREIYTLATKDRLENKTETLNQISIWKGEIAKIQKDSLEWKSNTKASMERTLKNLSQGVEDFQEQQREQKLLSLVNQTLLDVKKLENELFLNYFLLEQFTLLFQEKYASFGDRLYSSWLAIATFFKSQTSWFKESLFKIGDTPISPLTIFKVILIALGAYFLARIVQAMIKKFGERYSSIEPSAIYTLSRIVYYCIFYIGLFIAISSIGVDFTAFAFIAGAVTFWIGWGLVPIMTNFASGIIVLLDKNIRKGDLIQLESGERGTIAEMNVRTSILYTDDGQQMIIPNTELVIKKLINRSLHVGAKCLSIPFEVAFSADKEQVRNLVIAAAKELNTTYENRIPQVYLKRFDKDSLHFELKVWITRKEGRKEPEQLYSTYLWTIETTFREHGIPL